MTLPKHMPALDGLRGVAIVMVVFTHCGDGWTRALSVYQDSIAMPSGFHLPSWLIHVAASAVNGVPLFFVVSAFTLTTRAIAGPQDWRSYALRRIARVGPAYWIAGIAYLAISGLGPVVLAPAGVSATDIAVAAAFGTVWQGGPAYAVVPGGWSVSAEVTFYLILPFLVAAIDRRLIRAAALTCILIFVSQAIARHSMASGAYDFFVYTSPSQQMPVFLCGVTAAYLVSQAKMPRLPGLAFISLAAGIVLIPILVSDTTQLLQFALLAALAVAVASIDPPRWLANTVMVRLGKLSFSVYLVHFALLLPSLSVARWALPAMDWRTLALHFAIVLAGGAGIASVTWRFIEQPPIRWAARVSRRMPSAAGVAPAR